MDFLENILTLLWNYIQWSYGIHHALIEFFFTNYEAYHLATSFIGAIPILVFSYVVTIFKPETTLGEFIRDGIFCATIFPFVLPIVLWKFSGDFLDYISNIRRTLEHKSWRSMEYMKISIGDNDLLLVSDARNKIFISAETRKISVKQ